MQLSSSVFISTFVLLLAVAKATPDNAADATVATITEDVVPTIEHYRRQSGKDGYTTNGDVKLGTDAGIIQDYLKGKGKGSKRHRREPGLFSPEELQIVDKWTKSRGRRPLRRNPGNEGITRNGDVRHGTELGSLKGSIKGGKRKGRKY